MLDDAGVAIRSGRHCTQPLHRYLGLNSSARASFYFYNTKQEIDVFIVALKDANRLFSTNNWLNNYYWGWCVRCAYAPYDFFIYSQTDDCDDLG